MDLKIGETYRYSLSVPFLSQDAKRFDGYEVEVRTFDSGLSGCYRGVLKQRLTLSTTVGDDQLFNDYIRSVRVLREPV